MSRQLFSRREFLGTTFAAATAAIANADSSPAITIGSGLWTYTLDPTWGILPSGMKYGYGCAIVVDGHDRVYVTSRSVNPCVAVFNRDGKLLETWTKDFTERVGFKPSQYAATAHGLYWSKEKDGEYFYWTENVAGGRNNAPKIGARVYKTDLKGEVLYTLGPGVKKSSDSDEFNFVSPTDVAVNSNGDIYVVDGYGSFLAHRFDKNFKLIKTIGGKGTTNDKFNTPHGVWISTFKGEPEIYIADRANNRVQVFSPELEFKRTLGDFRLPCCFYQHGGHTFIPELGARVSILDRDDKVVARLGDGGGIDKKEVAKHPDKFFTPHALTVDSRGDLYVIEWLDFGRPRKFRHTPA